MRAAPSKVGWMLSLLSRADLPQKCANCKWSPHHLLDTPMTASEWRHAAVKLGRGPEKITVWYCFGKQVSRQQNQCGPSLVSMVLSDKPKLTINNAEVNEISVGLSSCAPAAMLEIGKWTMEDFFFLFWLYLALSRRHLSVSSYRTTPRYEVFTGHQKLTTN